MTDFFIGVIMCAAIVSIAIVSLVAMAGGFLMMTSLWRLKILKSALGMMLLLLGFGTLLWTSWEIISCVGVGANVRWVQGK